MGKVDFTKLNSANVSVDNLVDGEREYDIKSNANLNSGILVSVDGGSVTKDGQQLATFSKYGSNLAPTFMNVTDVMDMCSILTAITNFITDIDAEIAENPIVI